ncbi:MAG: ribose-phosphate pyrophosphokinase [Ignavibacteria bacterium GWA2_35_9]|nr:MAG: ribose-phosphate pyrophosphokinase [Ignavibacteria bacterium GWA2_35_9]OGU50088.1 MAG: ribose-phosphate pyrophosphokinase [Ignavibacteria bacterium GWC2_36_12]
MATGGYKIFSGSSNRALAEKIAANLGEPLGLVELKRFSDGEIWVKYLENIRGLDVFIIQSTIPPSDNILELLIMIDAAKRSSAKRITAVIPYFGYSRQDRKDQPRVSITAKLVANLITVAGADRVITMDLHAAQIQGFFDIPFDHLYSSSLFSGLFRDVNKNLVVVSPDIGGIKLARSYAKRLHCGLVVIDKRRPKQNLAEVVHIIGNVENKDVLLVDDLVDTAGTLVSAIEALKKNGAKNIYSSITHPLLSGPALDRINKSEITKLYVSDTIPFKAGVKTDKISVITASEIFAEAIKRTHFNESISSLFDIDKG